MFVQVQFKVKNMSGGWGCPHEVDGRCQRVEHKKCDPGMKGRVLAGKFIFSDKTRNTNAAKIKKLS